MPLAVVRRLRPKLSDRSYLAARHAPENQEAYTLYLKGRYCYNKWTPEGVQKSIEYFDQSLGQDPKYAAAYAGLANLIAEKPWSIFVVARKVGNHVTQVAPGVNIVLALLRETKGELALSVLEELGHPRSHHRIWA